MSAVSTYGLVNARVRTRRSALLSASSYKALASATDLREMLNLLTRYKNRLSFENLPDYSIEALERLLIQEKARQILDLKYSSRGPARDIMALMLSRIDAENVKTILRAWQKSDQNVSNIIECTGLAILPITKMLSAEDLTQFAAYINQLPFYEAFLKAAKGFDRSKSLFDIEVAIDKSLYQSLWDLTALLNKTDQHIVRRMVGIEIDLKNLDWIARIRKYYQSQIKVTETSLIPNGYRLPYATLRKMITTGSIEDGLEKILPGLTPITAQERDQLTALERLEQFLNQALFHEANRLFLENPLSIASTIGYYYLVHIETRNLCTLINAKYYKLAPQAVLNKLVY